jgi:hypothetical protein
MIHETVKAHPVDRFCRIVFGGLLFGGLALAGCARQAVVGSPGTPGADASEATLRSDLEALDEAEQRFNAANGRYTNQHSAIAATGDSECAVFGGEARPPRSYVTQPGLVGCRP